MSVRQYSFCELAKKCVVNVADGKELGRICDLIFNGCAQVIGIVVPGKKNLLRAITTADNLFIPWNRIVKIGADVILVELVGNLATTFATPNESTQTNDNV